MQETTFVGLDMKDVQPNLDVLAEATDAYADLAKRVKWVHQNLSVCALFSAYNLTTVHSLDRIHLQSEQFDFVRIHFIGLGVPEDEVHSFLVGPCVRADLLCSGRTY
jgi:hypothetical protein